MCCALSGLETSSELAKATEMADSPIPSPAHGAELCFHQALTHVPLSAAGIKRLVPAEGTALLCVQQAPAALRSTGLFLDPFINLSL